MDIRYILFAILIGLTAACARVDICEPNLKPPSLAELSGSLQDSEKERESSNAFLGVAYRLIPTDTFSRAGVLHGYLIYRVMPDSAAEKAGLLAGDIMLEFDGIRLDAIPEEEHKRYFSEYVREKKRIGDSICLKVLRQTSDIKVERHGETLYPGSKKELDALIAAQPPDKKITVTIDNKIRILNFNVVLGAKEHLAEQDLPANGELFPEYEKLATQHEAFMSQLIGHFDLQKQYQDIISRYREDELWDDGFRLNLFRYLHRDPFKFIPVVEEKTDRLAGLSRDLSFNEIIREAGGFLDVTVEPDNGKEFLHGNNQEYLEHIREVVDTAWEYRQKAFAQLSAEEIGYLEEQLVLLFDRFSHSYYIEQSQDSGESEMVHNRKIFELAQKVDFPSLFQSASILAELTDPQWLAGLQDVLLREEGLSALTVEGVSGTIFSSFSSKAGPVIIGGPGRNIYKAAAAVIIDLGGDDLYTGKAGLGDERQQVAAIFDLSGNDEYLATERYAQGSTISGVGLLYDLSGDDLYIGTRFSQGSAVLGIGILADLAGNDRYFGEDFNQGVAFWGAGILLDAKGNDYYQSNLFAQGVGGVKGLGALLDNTGDDFYFAGGRDKSSYGTSGIFKGSSQGLGIGFRGYASGGIGLLLDGNGEDSFWAGNFSQGTGYFFGIGIIRNFGAGDDTYTASRYGQGASAHSAAGILLDDGGNDRYNGYHIALQGAAWDLGMAALVDKGGNDIYHGSNGFSQAAASHNGMAFFIDAAGMDQYFGDQALAENNDYHGGSSLSFFIDEGGAQDFYTSGMNNSITLQGEYGIRMDLKDTVENAAGDGNYFRQYGISR